MWLWDWHTRSKGSSSHLWSCRTNDLSSSQTFEDHVSTGTLHILWWRRYRVVSHQSYILYDSLETLRESNRDQYFWWIQIWICSTKNQSLISQHLLSFKDQRNGTYWVLFVIPALHRWRICSLCEKATAFTLCITFTNSDYSCGLCVLVCSFLCVLFWKKEWTTKVFLRFCSQEIFVRGNEFIVESDDFLSKAANFTRMTR